MRNGNDINDDQNSDPQAFLPYLWGMETSQFDIEIVVDHKFLPYLWGMETSIVEFRLLWQFLVLTVPMRNGNLGKQYMLKAPSLSSYRTYEEWKQYVPNRFRMSWNGSYRTYEEWKPVSQVSTTSFSYVLTVPMRNGNWTWQSRAVSLQTSSYRTYEEWKRSLEYQTKKTNEAFLPYLWGMETGRMIIKTPSAFQFLPYLWGMETLVPKRWIHCRIQVLTVPMRNGNVSGNNYSVTYNREFLPYLWGMETPLLQSS